MCTLMTTHNPKVIHITTLQEAEKEIGKIGSDPKSIPIMAPKAISRVIKLQNVLPQDAIIIKQDMLSVGGEVAVPKHTFNLQKTTADILIMGTIKQLQDLIGKLNRHYPRLQNIAKELETILKEET